MITPKDYVGALMELAQQRRGEFVDMTFLTEARTTLVYNLPLAEARTRARRAPAAHRCPCSPVIGVAGPQTAGAHCLSCVSSASVRLPCQPWLASAAHRSTEVLWRAWHGHPHCRACALVWHGNAVKGMG